MKIFAGITPNNELYFLEIEQQADGMFRMSGETVTPILYDEAVEQSRESLEDGELWKMAVEADQTTLGLDEWIDDVLLYDGEISQIDNSLFPEEMEIEGDTYIFESQSCGQHVEPKLKYYAFDRKLFKKFIKLWETKHLTKGEVVLPVLPKQDINKEVEKAVIYLNNHDENL